MIIDTDRLILRRWDLSKDLKTFAAIIQDEKVMEFFPNLGNEESAKEFINLSNAHIDQYGYGWFACEVKETNQLIGFVGLSHLGFEAHFTPCVEIGWRLAYNAWGKGYAPEAAKKCLELGFSRYNLPEVVSFTTVKNIKSRRVMEKLGMSYNMQDDFYHPKLDKEHPLSLHVLYRLKNPAVML